MSRPPDECQRPRCARPWHSRSSLGIRPRTAGAAPHAGGRDMSFPLRAVRSVQGLARGTSVFPVSHRCPDPHSEVQARRAGGIGTTPRQGPPGRTHAPSVHARWPAGSGRGRRPANAWGSAGFARRTPSREGMGTLPGFPSAHWSREAPEAERAMDARSAAVGMRLLAWASGGLCPTRPVAGRVGNPLRVSMTIEGSSLSRPRKPSAALPSGAPVRQSQRDGS
jgi:hypothetical protein